MAEVVDILWMEKTSVSKAATSPTVTLPAPFADIVVPNHDPAEIQRWGLEAMVLTAFGEKQVSTGYAAELLGMSYFEFLALVKERGIPLKLTEEEMEQDRADLDAMFSDSFLKNKLAK
jgi:predicted HTH domain antitoxin